MSGSMLNKFGSVTKAAWGYMREQKYGRVVNVTSAAGLYGNFGQTNYAAMKAGINGFSLSAAREGEKRNIKVNVIAPLAASRMTETVMPPFLLEKLNADYVAPLVAYLAHQDASVTGGIYEVGAGWISKVRWQRSDGIFMSLQDLTPECVAKNIENIEVCIYIRYIYSTKMHRTSIQNLLTPYVRTIPSRSSWISYHDYSNGNK